VSARLSRIANSIVTQALVLVLITRIGLYGVNWFSLKVMPPSWEEASRVVGGWIRWDGGHYIRIAMNGYADAADPGSPAFFPLYPLLMRGFTEVLGLEPTRGALGLAGVVISAACFFIAVPLFAQYAEKGFGTEVARLASILLIVSPFSLFFSASYTESLFLLLVVLTFVLAGKDRWVLAAVVVALATATRLTGVALIPALLLMAWKAKLPWRDLIRIAIISPLGILAFMVHTWRELDDPFAFLTVQSEWGGWHERWGQFLDVYLRSPRDIFTGEHFYAVALLNLALFVLCIACLPSIWRRLDPGLALISTLIMVQGMTSLISLGRYLLPAIGVYIVLAFVLVRPGLPSLIRQAGVICSVMLLTMLTILFAHDYWVI
jgi:Gpi18-like mannosyltransferase